MTFISYRCIYTVIWILIVIHFNLPCNFKILTSIFSHTFYKSFVNFGILNTYLNKYLGYVSEVVGGLYTSVPLYFISWICQFFFSVQSNFWRYQGLTLILTLTWFHLEYQSADWGPQWQGTSRSSYERTAPSSSNSQSEDLQSKYQTD